VEIDRGFDVEDGKVVFTEENVKRFVDHCIRKWNFSKESSFIPEGMWCCYVDAYQQVRIALFGETLELDGNTEV